MELMYDDSPWSEEEMDLLAEEAGELLDKYREPTFDESKGRG
jgi:hypothetical protein